MPSIFTLSGSSWYEKPAQVKRNLPSLAQRKQRPATRRTGGVSGSASDDLAEEADRLGLSVNNHSEATYKELQAARRVLVAKACKVGALDVERGARVFYPIIHEIAKTEEKQFQIRWPAKVKWALAREYADKVKRQINACQRGEKWGCNDLPDMKLPKVCKLPPGGLAGARKR